MLRGKTIFRCDKCGKVFVGMDIELAATIFSQPQPCPRCGSMHTKPPLAFKSIYKKIWEETD